MVHFGEPQTGIVIAKPEKVKSFIFVGVLSVLDYLIETNHHDHKTP